ncbi:MAG: hypothetical protein JW747_08525 [Candidatus Aminicenantes bacterium]|nr:hypothetical protein [Candidatus Aminicenantes bacterium]
MSRLAVFIVCLTVLTAAAAGAISSDEGLLFSADFQGWKGEGFSRLHKGEALHGYRDGGADNFAKFEFSAAAAPKDEERKKRSWRFGFSERFRYDTWDNVRTLDAGRSDGRAVVFLRTRFSLDAALSRRMEFGIRLTHEARQAVTPAGESFQWDEAVFDRFHVRWTVPGSLPLTLTLGRQSLFVGEGFLVAEGTPLDETRSDYFNALRLDWTPAGGRRLTFFACHQTEKDSLLPVIRSRSRPLVEQPETGLGLVYARIGERWDWEASVVYKKSLPGSIPLPEGDVLTFDGRLVRSVLPEIVFSGEAAFQTGTRGGARLFSWGANGRLSWDLENTLPVPLRISAGALALAGDDPASETYEGWTPLFSRWPRWSESYIYTLAEEQDGRTAWWSNLTSLFGEIDVRPTGRLALRLGVHLLGAPRTGPAAWDEISGSGHVRGTLWSAMVTVLLSERLRGHLLYEGFRPGDFYVPEADGYSFLRFELLWEF